jgi:hypothetical protein
MFRVQASTSFVIARTVPAPSSIVTLVGIPFIFAKVRSLSGPVGPYACGPIGRTRAATITALEKVPTAYNLV